MFSLIGAIIVGFIAGALAKLIMPGKDPGGCFITTLLGIGGAIIATWLGQFVGFYRYGETAGLIGAIVGAVVAILAAYRAMKK
jgi:uncharacterized membrane protein YeaQ/YmgE (transglycosylase-associated protein family)